MQDKWLSETVKIARQSLCQRAKCGVIIVKEQRIIGSGYNAPPLDSLKHKRCLKKVSLKIGFKSDRTCCVHAEQRAIMDALTNYPANLLGSRLYFIRLDLSGSPEPAGQPYCTICSKMTLDSGIAEFALWHKEGLKVYKTGEYNNLSFAYSGKVKNAIA